MVLVLRIGDKLGPGGLVAGGEFELADGNGLSARGVGVVVESEVEFFTFGKSDGTFGDDDGGAVAGEFRESAQPWAPPRREACGS